MRVDITYYSALGGRDVNEDAISVLESGKTVLAVAADGLGGQGGGDAASKCVVSTLNSVLQNCTVSEKMMCNAIAEANKKIITLQNENTKMMSTVAALWLTEHSAVAANVGDSRIYQFRDGQFIYQSVDHSVAQMAVYGGEISADQIRSHIDRNKLVRALGAEHQVKVSSKMISVEKDDCFLICTDGFWDHITEKQMLEQMEKSSDVTDWLSNMRRRVEKAGGLQMDNHSAIALKIH